MKIVLHRYLILSLLFCVVCTKDMNPPPTMPAGQFTTLKSGNFSGSNTYPGFGSGSGSIVQDENNNLFVRLGEDFTVMNGPDLNVYITRDYRDNNIQDFIDLGDLKEITGAQNYAIPSGTDVTPYTHIVIYCVTAGGAFSKADLVTQFTMPAGQFTTLKSGNFSGSNTYDGSGSGSIVQDENNNLFVRLGEDFMVMNGPDLNVYITQGYRDRNIENFIDLGDLTGAQNYAIPSETDVALYTHIVIYCVAFNIAFSKVVLVTQ